MKLKHILTLLGVSFSLAAVGAVGVAAGEWAGEKDENLVAEVKAYDEGTTYYCLTGVFNGESHWTDYVNAPSDGNNAGVLLNYTLHAGDTFKFKVKGSWDDALSFGNYNSSAGAYNAFCWNKGDDNTYCAVTGAYNFYIWNDSGTMKISAEFADSNTATYSYVLTNDSGIGYTHLYNSTLSLRGWSAAPAANGQAYDIKLSYNSYDYYGLYRIDDRILSGWDTLIMKSSDGSKQSADIDRTAGNKEELYLCGATVVTKAKTTDEYKAVEFLYNLVSHRGAASYEGKSVTFSVCATTPDDAYDLVAAYDGFASGIIAILDNASVNTYKVDVVAEIAENNKSFQSVESVVDALRVVASRKGQSINSLFENKVSDSSTIIIVVTVLTLLTVSSLIVIRKRKQEN